LIAVSLKYEFCKAKKEIFFGTFFVFFKIMEKLRISPISGDHFEDFMLLTNPDHKSSKTKQAWQVLQQQTQAHVPSSKIVDLNRICIDTIRMELLIFPVVEHWKRPLTNAEWNHIDKEFVQLEKQMEKIRKLSILVRKKDPLAFPDISPLFKKLLDHNQELRNYWTDFKRAWSDYKKEWGLFQSRKKKGLKSRQKPSKSQPDYHAKDSSAEENTEPPVSPPMFSRDRWHALRLSSKAFEVEVLHQCQRFRAGTKQDPEELKDASHPVVKFLVEELRKIYLKTHGFELIKRVKLVQKRNDQLMQELQPYFPEPIISAEMRAETKPTTKHMEISAGKNEDKISSTSKSIRKIIFIFILFFLGGLALILLLNQVRPPVKEKMKHLKFVPKNKTLTANSPASNKLPEFNLDDMMQMFNSNIPVLESNELLKKLITAPPEIMENIANSILRDIGKNAVFVFSEAQSLFLFWKGKLEKFTSPEGLQKKLLQLERQYNDVESLWKGMGDNTPEKVKVIPDILHGEPTYALEMLDENGDLMQVYMTEEGVLLRLSNGKLLDKPLTPEEATQKFTKF